MDQKLKNLERSKTILVYQKYSCIASMLIIIGLCVRGQMKLHWSIQEVIGVGILGIGLCVFSLLSGLNQSKVLDQKIAQYKSQQAANQEPD